MVGFGKYKGKLMTRVPVSYLKWLVTNRVTVDDVDYAKLAEDELKRRGTVIPEVDVSSHALDRFSVRYGHYWMSNRGHDEGIYTFLHTLAKKAWKKAKKRHETKVEYENMVFVFEADTVWPVLKTVM